MALPPPPPASQASQSVAYYANIFASKWGAIYGQEYTQYAAAHPTLSPLQAAKAFALIRALGGFDAALGAGTSAIATAEGKNFPQGAAIAANDLYHGLNLGTLLVRAAEILVGLVLIAVGVAKLTNAVPIATKVAKTVGAGALL